MTPSGLLKTIHVDFGGAPMRLPSTMIESAETSTACPMVATDPLIVTRPSAMISSALRREAIPARASARWMRIVVSPGSSAGSLGGGVGSLRGLRDGAVRSGRRPDGAFPFPGPFLGGFTIRPRRRRFQERAALQPRARATRLRARLRAAAPRGDAARNARGRVESSHREADVRALHPAR